MLHGLRNWVLMTHTCVYALVNWLIIGPYIILRCWHIPLTSNTSSSIGSLRDKFGKTWKILKLPFQQSSFQNFETVVWNRVVILVGPHCADKLIAESMRYFQLLIFHFFPFPNSIIFVTVSVQDKAPNEQTPGHCLTQIGRIRKLRCLKSAPLG